MSKKIYDPRLVWPYSLLLCGPTGCEETTWIVELLKSHEEMCTHTPKELIWIYGVEQPELFKTIEEIWSPCQCEFIEGFPEDLMSRLQKSNDQGSLCIFDDVMNEVSSNATISKLFTLEYLEHLEYFVCHRPFSSDKIVWCTLFGPVYTAVLFQAFLQYSQDIFVYSDVGMVYSGICIDLKNKYILNSVLYIDKCTLQYCIRLFIGYI